VNLVIAAGLWTWFQVTREGLTLAQMGVTSGTFAERILLANISLVVFNLLPAFPMDGGRILQALLARRLEYTRATQTAGRILQQPDVDVRLTVRLDRRRAGVEHGFYEIRLGWNSGERGYEDYIRDGCARRFH